MKKRYLFIILLSFVALNLKAQNYALFNTKTLIDGFENPAIRTFTLDSSRKFASNFFLPMLSTNVANTGSAETVMRKLLAEHVLDARGLPVGSGLRNHLVENSNVYVLAFKVFSSYKYNQEVGFSWQIRTDANVNYTNESLAIFQDYKNFSNIPYHNVFNDSGYAQSYHQFSVSIRENYDKKLALGIKLSLLSGISYNSIDINDSYFYADAANNRIDIGLNGTYRGTFIRGNELEKKMLLPTFKNPGLSLTLGTTYQSTSGFFLMGNIKDLGFLHWNKKSHVATLNTITSIYNVSNRSNNDINRQITDIAYDADQQKGFYTPTNAKADFLISKTFNFYKPSIVISKNLFHPGGDVAFVNTFTLDRVSASLTPAYNFNDFIMFGIQGTYKTPNFDLIMGTDNLGKTISTVRSLNQSDGSVGTGYNAASFYMGLGIKFGRTVEHPMNLSRMPGVGGERTYKGFFRSLFEFFKK